MSFSSRNHLLLYEGCVSCFRGAGITDSLISSYHLSAGSPPALGIWLSDRSQADWQLLCHIQPWLLLSRGPRLSLVSRFFLKKKLFALYVCLICCFKLFIWSLPPGVCHVIIFRSHLPIYLEI